MCVRAQKKITEKQNHIFDLRASQEAIPNYAWLQLVHDVPVSERCSRPDTFMHTQTHTLFQVLVI